MRIEIVINGAFIVVDENETEKANAFFTRNGLSWHVENKEENNDGRI